jgi:integrase
MKRKEPNLAEIDGQLYARVSYKDPRTGRWKSKTKRVKNRLEGRTVAAKLREQYARATAAQLDAETMTFGELLDNYPKPLPAWYSTPLRDWFGLQKLQAIDYAALNRFREHRLTVPTKTTRDKEVKKLRAVASINREMEVLRRVLIYAHKQGWIARNPFSQGDSLLPKAAEGHRDRIPNDDEINRLLEYAIGPRAYLRPLIFAAMDTGLRRGKLLALTLAQIDFDRGLIDVGKRKVRTKKHPRFVGMTARLMAELRDWLGTRESWEPDQLIFAIGDFKRAWGTLCRLAKVYDLHFHDLRHRYATNTVLAGVPKELAMKQGGWSEESTFDRYFNVDAQIARSVAEALDSQVPRVASQRTAN